MTTVERELADSGTPEGSWQAWDGLAAFSPMAIPVTASVVVVAPHPDDEILGCAGLLQRVNRRNVKVTLVAVTDGEASHPGSPTVTPSSLAARRTRETEVALERLGLGSVIRVALHVPDGRVCDHEQDLAKSLLGLVSAGSLCLAPWDGDGHPDHDAVGRAASDAARRSGATLVQYLVWTWHWAAPGDPAVPWARAAQLHLSGTEQKLKRRAIDTFDSQVRPLSAARGDAAVLDANEIAHHTRDFEVFLT